LFLVQAEVGLIDNVIDDDPQVSAWCARVKEYKTATVKKRFLHHCAGMLMVSYGEKDLNSTVCLLTVYV